MRFTGRLKTWTDDRGFGFITPTVAVRIAEMHSASSRHDSSRRSRDASLPAGGLLRGIVTLAMIVLVAWYGYRQYIRRLPPPGTEAMPAQGSRELPQSSSCATSWLAVLAVSLMAPCTRFRGATQSHRRRSPNGEFP